ncbi:MAG TPA: DNA alkylation repair protein [Candidatus Limnocylindrales bacterium]|nr:DNA alkylation repair protein [Candidatus Limnocylindrales bacterium]
MTAATTAPGPDRPISPITERAVAFVAEHKPAAEALGRSLADLTGDPEAFAVALRRGMATLADAEYAAGQRRIAPGIGPVIGVRWPLIEAVKRGFRDSTTGERTSTWLFLADRILRDDTIEPRWFAFGLLERTIADEPERTWQLVRRAAREATDWATVDALAHVVGKGILNEPYRWAELEQLVFSPNRWERRLVGSTIATTPFVDHKRGRQPEIASRGLDLIAQLIGDDQPDVQKSLSWALRSLVIVDKDAVTAFCEREAAIAASGDDGHRAWVVRDALSKLDESTARDIKARLDGIRRRPGAPATSIAATAADRFGQGMLGRPLPEPPLS